MDDKSKVSQKVITYIVEMIRSGKLRVGDKLPPERVLTEQLGISRASLREALAALDIIGLIEVRHGEGSFVSNLNLAHFLNTIAPLFVSDDQMESDMLDFRRLLELEALHLVFEKRVRDTGGLRACLAQMRAALEGGDIEGNAEADVNFHRTLMGMSGNKVLMTASDYVEYLMAQSVRFNVSKILQNPRNGEILYAQHRDLCEMIEEGLEKEAKNLLTSHLDFVKKV